MNLLPGLEPVSYFGVLLLYSRSGMDFPELTVTVTCIHSVPCVSGPCAGASEVKENMVLTLALLMR